MSGAFVDQSRWKEEKIELIKQRDKLEEARRQLDKSNLAEDERIGKEIKKLHARIAELDKKIMATLLKVE